MMATGRGAVVLAPLQCALSLGAQSAGAPFLARTVQAQMIVLDGEAAKAARVGWTESQGGYFLYAAEDRVELRVPVASFELLREVAADVADELLFYEPSARDLREELGRIEAGIHARREVLELNSGFLDDADVNGTLVLEREISDLIGELEMLEGRRRKLEHDRAFARATVHLSSRTVSLPAKRPSSFSWINTLDLYHFLEESRYGY